MGLTGENDYSLLGVGGKLDAMYEDAQAALWRRPCGEELKPPANSQNQLASHGRVPFWSQILQAQLGLKITTAQTQNHPAKLLLNS